MISPETQYNIGKTVAETKAKASFPIVHDQNFAIMKAYHTAFTVKPDVVAKYQGFGVDLLAANGADAAVLLVPATYVVGKDGKIKYAYFNSYTAASACACAKWPPYCSSKAGGE